MQPLAAGAHEAEQAVQQAPHVRGPRPPAGLGGWDERLKAPELVIRQGLTGPEIPDQRAIRRRPHDVLQAGNRVQRRQQGPGQPGKLTKSPFQNGDLAGCHGSDAKLSSTGDIPTGTTAGAE